MFKLFKRKPKYDKNNTKKSFAIDIINDAIDNKSDYIFYSITWCSNNKKTLIIPYNKFNTLLSFVYNCDDDLYNYEYKITITSIVGTDDNYSLKEILDALKENKF